MSVFSCSNLPRGKRVSRIVATQQITVYSSRPFVMPVDTLHRVYSNLNFPKRVARFYQLRGGTAYWLGSDSTKFIEFYNIIYDVRYLGLTESQYHLTEFEIKSDSARLEALLTDAFFTLEHELLAGKNAFSGYASESDSSALDAIDSGATLVQYIKSCEPHFTGYSELKGALRELIDSAAWHTLTDSTLISRYQVIATNMSRWRQLPGAPSRYLLVNIPDYTLYLVVDDSVIATSRIIVGKPESPTPEWVGVIDRITINPYWYVPRKIAVDEYLPLVQADTSFLANHNFEVLDRKGDIVSTDRINWSEMNAHTFNVVLRQRNGPKNSLGLFKFVFDNPYAVYLHDTNAKSLFSKQTRAFSHGCVRVAKAEVLAHYLVTGSLVKRSEKINAAIASGKVQTIRLARPLPIFITYLTAAGIDGKLKFFPDIYQKDFTDQ